MWTEQQYDAQIKELTQNPGKIANHWMSGRGLFKWTEPDDSRAGCLTTIRSGNSELTASYAVIKSEIDEQLTAEIRADERIPKEYSAITPEHLPVFKEWQMRIDTLQNA